MNNINVRELLVDAVSALNVFQKQIHFIIVKCFLDDPVLFTEEVVTFLKKNDFIPCS